MALSFIITSIQKLKTKTAYQTDSITDEALHQQSDAVVVSPSRASTFSRQHTQLVPPTPSEKSSHTTEVDHLPPIRHPPATIFRQHLTNGSTHGFQVHNNKSSPVPTKKYITKTMSTTTTMRKSFNGGPVTVNGRSPHSSRTPSSESNRKTRTFWWSPKRNQIEIRSDGTQYKQIPSRIGSLMNIEHRPGGGQVAIRDERVKWQVTSKINSLANANWSPPLPRVTVRKEKIRWDVQPKIGSMINIDHKPAGGNIAIRDDKIDLSHVTPRVDCGFLD